MNLDYRATEPHYCYAMHFGRPLRVIDSGFRAKFKDALKEAGMDALVTFYADGDNCYEWGESIMTHEQTKTYGGGLDTDEAIRAMSGHFMLFVPKGIHPRLVWNYLVDEIEELQEDGFILSAGQLSADFEGLPFVVDEAAVWGENVDTAWLPDTECDSFAYWESVRLGNQKECF